MSQPLAEHTQIQAIIDQGLRIFTREYLHFFTITEFIAKFGAFGSGAWPAGPAGSK
jgi:hypothetical protein